MIVPVTARSPERTVNPRPPLRPWAARPLEPAPSNLAARLLWITVLLVVLGLLLTAAEAAPTHDPSTPPGSQANLLQTNDFVTGV